MKILLIARGVPSLSDPQYGCFEFDQAKALVANGHEVHLMYVDSRYRKCRRKIGISEYRKDGVYCYSSYWIPGKLSRLIGGNRLNKKIKERQYHNLLNYVIENKGKPDIIYSHYLFITAFITPIAIPYNIPLVAIEHWSEISNTIIQKDVLALGFNTYKYVDRIIAVSDSLKKALKDRFNTDARVVHNMIGTEFTDLKIYSNSSDTTTFVSTGSLIFRKGYDLLIKAFDSLSSSGYKWKLIIIGEGEERNSLQKMIDSSKSRDNIKLVGKKTKSEIVEILLMSDVFVLPSRNENFSVAVLEALACGLPVIASICGGIRECIDDTNGLLFPVDDEKMLSKHIKYMLNNHSKYDKDKIRTDCMNKYSPDCIASSLTKIFDEVINDYKHRNI